MATASSTELMWERLARPYVTADVVDAVLGLPATVVRQLAGTLLATCAESEALLTATPVMLRSLSIAITTSPEVCRGGLRGPIQWSETMSARAASYGPDDIFVCATPSRAYDTPENRIMAAALNLIRVAGREADMVDSRQYDDVTLRRARQNGSRAQRFLDHRAMTSVPRQAPPPRVVQKVRAAARTRTYDPALAMLHRSNEPLSARDVVPFVDSRTRSQHNVLMAIVDGLAKAGIELPAFRAVGGGLEAGPVRYVHPRRRGSRTGNHGIFVGRVLVDVPHPTDQGNRSRAEASLAIRADGRPSQIVVSRRDVSAALEVAMGDGGLEAVVRSPGRRWRQARRADRSAPSGWSQPGVARAGVDPSAGGVMADP